MTASPTKDDPATRIARHLIADKNAFTAARPGVPYTLGLAANCIRAQLAVEYPPPPPKAKRALVNGRNLHFDALAEACGYTGKVTKTAGGQVAAALKEILEVSPQATPDDIARTAKAVRKRFDNAGPKAVCAHWHDYSAERKRTDTAKKDIYTEPPPEWRSVAKKLYADALEWASPHDFATMAWKDVNDTIRRGILAKLYP